MNANSNLKLDYSKQFYPTPLQLARKMVRCITDWNEIKNVLEPSAGTGNLLQALALEKSYYRFEVDCIEIQPELRAVLQDKFSSNKNNDVSSTIVADDFLKFHTYKKYDLILMNPPFRDGVKHLLKALEIQKNGGTIVCLLNAETLKNPFTNERKLLHQQLEKYSADVEYIDGAFSDAEAENKADVEVALIKVYIPKKAYTSEILKSLVRDSEDIPSNDYVTTALDVNDFIKSAINRCNFEMEVGLRLIDEYEALKPYMLSSLDLDSEDNYVHPLINIESDNPRKEYIEGTRRKYWRALLFNPKFVGKLPSNLKDEYRDKVNELKNYDFSECNINRLAVEMASKLKESIEDRIMELFSEFTQEHSYYPECTSTIHYYNGWKTNKAHKIGPKVIIPFYGITNWNNDFDVFNISSKIDDIEKILNFFDGTSLDVNNREVIKNALDNGINRNIELKYFYVSFFKKGTMHLKFKDETLHLIDRFNIYAGQKKSWLPPSYGKVRYEDMSKEEQEVINSFQGKADYDKVFQNSSYYLAPVCGSNMLMLEG